MSLEVILDIHFVHRIHRKQSISGYTSLLRHETTPIVIVMILAKSHTSTLFSHLFQSISVNSVAHGYGWGHGGSNQVPFSWGGERHILPHVSGDCQVLPSKPLLKWSIQLKATWAEPHCSRMVRVGAKDFLCSMRNLFECKCESVLDHLSHCQFVLSHRLPKCLTKAAIC